MAFILKHHLLLLCMLHSTLAAIKAIKGRRHEVVLATKRGIVTPDDGKKAYDGSTGHVRSACEASLEASGDRLRGPVLPIEVMGMWEQVQRSYTLISSACC